jgi:flagellar hook-associated protein 3 FlgL
MRVTNNMVSDRVMSELQRNYASLAAAQQQVQTGKRVNLPSDDPTAAAAERMRKSELDGITKSQDSVVATQTRLTSAETSMESVRSVLSRANELAINGANGSLSQTDRNAIANEIDQLIRTAKDAMNTKVGGSYIFAGTASDTAPYADATGDAYQGNDQAIVREAGVGVTLQANPSFVAAGGATTTTPLTAGAILGGGSSSGDGKVLDTLTQLSAHLRGGTAADMVAIQSTDLQALKANSTAVSNAISAIGAMSNRATAATSRLEDLEDGANQAIDDLTGVDQAKAISDYMMQSSAYQASLKVGAQIIQPSLLQFIS